MSTLYVDGLEGELRRDGGAIGIWERGSRSGSVPIRPLERMVVCGGQVMLEAGLLHALAEAGVSVSFVSGRQNKFEGIFTGRLHANGRLRRHQYCAMEGALGLAVAREIVDRKISAQASALLEWAEARVDLASTLRLAASQVVRHREGVAACDEVSRLMGLEGAASAVHFGVYVRMFAPSLGFTARRRRPPPDPVNALLSLGYTLLYAEFQREVQVVGLDPALGFLHAFEWGRDSLPLDLVEPWRPAWETWVWLAFRDRQFRDRDFAQGGERSGCWMKKEARSRFYMAYEEWAEPLRPLFRRSVRELARQLGATEKELSDVEESVP